MHAYTPHYSTIAINSGRNSVTQNRNPKCIGILMRDWGCCQRDQRTPQIGSTSGKQSERSSGERLIRYDIGLGGGAQGSGGSRIDIHPLSIVAGERPTGRTRTLRYTIDGHTMVNTPSLRNYEMALGLETLFFTLESGECLALSRRYLLRNWSLAVG